MSIMNHIDAKPRHEWADQSSLHADIWVHSHISMSLMPFFMESSYSLGNACLVGLPQPHTERSSLCSIPGILFGAAPAA